MQRNHSCTSKMRKPPNLTNSVMSPYFFIYANRNKAEPRKVTKQVVWIILRNRIFHGTIRHIRSGFSLYARTLCALTLLAYALKHRYEPHEKKTCLDSIMSLLSMLEISDLACPCRLVTKQAAGGLKPKHWATRLLNCFMLHSPEHETYPAHEY